MKWKLELKKISDLKDYHKNPRRLSKEQYEHLKTSIDKFGLIDKPIITKDNILIGGHQRIQILKKENIKEVECWVSDQELTEKDIEELNIRLNKNTGEWDFDILANEWEIDDLLKWGFNPDELEIKNFDQIPNIDDLIADNANKPPIIKITFESQIEFDKAETEIKQIIEKYETAIYSVSAGEI